MTRYPIRAVARMTGLSLDTLRAWERRYAAVVPHRGRRGREYSDADVARLRSLATLVGQGYSIGAIATLDAAALARVLGTSLQPARPHGPDAPHADLQPLIDAIDSYDRDALESALNRHAMTLRPAELVSAVVVPLLAEIGSRWEQASLRPAQEHLATAAIRSVVGAMLRVATRQDGTPTVLFATPAGERHELGLLCAALLAASAGAGVLYLGPDLPAADIAHAATRAKADVVVLSLTTAAATTVRERRDLARLLRGFDVWVGGRSASALLEVMGARARHLTDLPGVVAGLPHRARP
jgi:DNA-binding transcriptional MerR regulator/methylmalonyl-CoA mutase cobalamin-binding subunit